MSALRVWHFFVGHNWRFYCKSCEISYAHTWMDRAKWHCDCGAMRERGRG